MPVRGTIHSTALDEENSSPWHRLRGVPKPSGEPLLGIAFWMSCTPAARALGSLPEVPRASPGSSHRRASSQRASRAEGAQIGISGDMRGHPVQGGPAQSGGAENRKRARTGRLHDLAARLRDVVEPALARQLSGSGAGLCCPSGSETEAEGRSARPTSAPTGQAATQTPTPHGDRILGRPGWSSEE